MTRPLENVNECLLGFDREKPGSCQFCKFWISASPSGVCKRNPEPRRMEPHQWCGEFAVDVDRIVERAFRHGRFALAPGAHILHLAHRCRTMWDVACLTEKAVIETKGIGRATLRDLKAYLWTAGLRFTEPKETP